MPSCKEVNPKKVIVHFEKDRGGYEKGKLSDIMPTDENPAMLIDGEND